jgi:triacylglycerol esterase/lipase EstA (alpha/beta hydrolase family)
MRTAHSGREFGVPVRRRRAAIAVAFCTLAMVAGVFTAGSAQARTNDRSKTVLFVHGYNPTSTNTDCGGDFDTMISQMRSEGFTGSMVKVGYYSNDSNCNVNLHSYGSYGDRDSWKNIAKAFSTYVYNTYTSHGIAVDVVGYSMGALISRGAVYGAQKGESGFSSPIDVEDEVTLGGPHQGAAWYSYLCLWGQCSSLKPGSTDINWLNGNGNPQGKNGTEWSNVGSYQDDVVPYQSATSMSIPASNKIVFSNVSHTGFIHPNYMHTGAVITWADNALANAGQ